jgi:hypothetical protein
MPLRRSEMKRIQLRAGFSVMINIGKNPLRFSVSNNPKEPFPIQKSQQSRTSKAQWG